MKGAEPDPIADKRKALAERVKEKKMVSSGVGTEPEEKPKTRNARVGTKPV